MTDTNARTWDRRFIRLLPIVTVAAIVSVAFGAPLDNLIAIAWLVPAWIAARLLEAVREGALCLTWFIGTSCTR